MTTTLASVLSKNRAEELGYDVWASFVVPPFFDLLGIHESKKPRLIVGGRGCGKTMLLRYLSHQSSFSKTRKEIAPHELKHIGLYWRADTQFANAMQRRNVSDEIWASAFSHFSALLLALEVLRSLQSIAESRFEGLASEGIENLKFPSVAGFDETLPVKYSELQKALHSRINGLVAWVNDVRKAPEPRLLPGTNFVSSIIADIVEQLPSFSEATFFVYVDEYENLAEYQQRLVNTWLKSSEAPLVFNLAMKRNGFRTRRTVGTESISDIHDYREHDIESYLEDEFEHLAAEILILRLSSTDRSKFHLRENLNDPACLAARKNAEYRREIRSKVDSLLPGMTEEALAVGVFDDSGLTQRLRVKISAALKMRLSGMSVDDFFRPELPKASIVAPALLFRKNLTPEYIASEMDKLASEQPSKFVDWIHNNFVGCLLQLYEPFSRACPFYAGFETFCHLAHGNIRYFLELCHRCLSANKDPMVIPPETQAAVARQASATFMKEIRSSGAQGNQLYTFVLSLGSLFALAHLRDTQSEAEQTHFSVREGARGLHGNDPEFLREAVKWSVLFESGSTKQKNENEPEGSEYVLNPIYAPYFHISYRKRRKIEITASELHRLIEGDYEQVASLLKWYREQWSVSTQALPLFSHLEDAH